MTYEVNLYCQFLFVQIIQITAIPENAIVHLSTSDTVQIIQITAIPENALRAFVKWTKVQIIQITAIPENMRLLIEILVMFK